MSSDRLAAAIAELTKAGHQEIVAAFERNDVRELKRLILEEMRAVWVARYRRWMGEVEAQMAQPRCSSRGC